MLLFSPCGVLDHAIFVAFSRQSFPLHLLAIFAEASNKNLPEKLQIRSTDAFQLSSRKWATKVLEATVQLFCALWWRRAYGFRSGVVKCSMQACHSQRCRATLCHNLGVWHWIVQCVNDKPQKVPMYSEWRNNSVKKCQDNIPMSTCSLLGALGSKLVLWSER